MALGFKKDEKTLVEPASMPTNIAKRTPLKRKTGTQTIKGGKTEKRVTILIPADEQNPKNTHVPAQVNGKTYRVKRGVRVNCPLSVYIALKHSDYCGKMHRLA